MEKILQEILGEIKNMNRNMSVVKKSLMNSKTIWTL